MARRPGQPNHESRRGCLRQCEESPASSGVWRKDCGGLSRNRSASSSCSPLVVKSPLTGVRLSGRNDSYDVAVMSVAVTDDEQSEHGAQTHQHEAIFVI